MYQFAKKYYDKLLAVVYILFILQLFSWPFVIYITYAGRSETPEHTITYTPGKLSWDENTKVNTNGDAKLSVFENKYNNVKGENSERVVAPGTNKKCIVRLKNDSTRTIRYTVILYQNKIMEELPIKIILNANQAEEISDFYLPSSIAPDSLTKAIAGTISSQNVQDFDIEFIWKFEENEESDLNDTELGNLAAQLKANRVNVGFYVVVEDEGEIISPDIPQTKDNIKITVYTCFIVLSGLTLVILLIFGRRNKDHENNIS